MDVASAVRTQHVVSGDHAKLRQPDNVKKEGTGAHELFPNRDTLTLSEEARRFLREQRVAASKKGSESQEAEREDQEKKKGKKRR